MKNENEVKHIVVTGGNGFLGKQICHLASQMHIPVISISRTGRPKDIKDEDYKNVQWISADIFNPETWKHYLNGCFAIIHSIGIIQEVREKNITFKKMILDAAKSLGTAAKEADIKRFVFISASAGAPETPSTYMENKLAAEQFLSSLGFSLAILKPAMLFGKEHPYTIKENEAIQKLLIDPHIGPRIKPNRPLAVEIVAKVALYAALNFSIIGKLNVDEIEKLSEVQL